MGIPMLKIRRSRDRLIFNMEIPILVRRHIYIETTPRSPQNIRKRKTCPCFMGCTYIPMSTHLPAQRWGHISAILAELHRLPGKQPINLGPISCLQALNGLPPAYIWLTFYHGTSPLGTWGLPVYTQCLSLAFGNQIQVGTKEHGLLQFTMQ